METIIKWTNRVAMLAILLLVYWVFVFISITVFDLKVFKENITEVFFLSILGILALMFGSLVVNIMFNLTKISKIIGEHYDARLAPTSSKVKRTSLLLLLIFPLLFAFLYIGDMGTTRQKEKLIVESAEQLVNEHEDVMTAFSKYVFNKSFIDKTANSLQFLKAIDEHFPDIDLIIEDEIDGKAVFLKFDSYGYSTDKEKQPRKVRYILPSSKSEREYLSNAFKNEIKNYRFGVYNGFYELYYPVHINNKIIVLYLTDRKDYGKMGS